MEAKHTPAWLLWGCRASGTWQKSIGAGLSISHIFKGLGEGFLTVFSSASAVQGARWLLGTVSWHLSWSLAPAGWLPVADAGLWLKSISSEHTVCSRGLSRVICTMHSHPCLVYIIQSENNSDYEICKKSLWPQHFENKMHVIVYAFVVLYANWLMKNECSIFISVGKLKSFTLHNSSSSVNLNDCLYLWFLFCGVAWRMAVMATTLINMSLPNHTVSYMLK